MHTNPRDHTYGILVHAHLTTPLASKIRLALSVVNSIKLHLIALKFPYYSLIHPIIRQQTRHLSNTFNKINFYQCILTNGVNELVTLVDQNGNTFSCSTFIFSLHG